MVQKLNVDIQSKGSTSPADDNGHSWLERETLTFMTCEGHVSQRVAATQHDLTASQKRGVKQGPTTMELHHMFPHVGKGSVPRASIHYSEEVGHGALLQRGDSTTGCWSAYCECLHVTVLAPVWSCLRSNNEMVIFGPFCHDSRQRSHFRGVVCRCSLPSVSQPLPLLMKSTGGKRR